MVQLSVKFISLCMREASNGSVSEDKLETMARNPTTINMYVNHGENAIWDDDDAPSRMLMVFVLFDGPGFWTGLALTPANTLQSFLWHGMGRIVT